MPSAGLRAKGWRILRARLRQAVGWVLSGSALLSLPAWARNAPPVARISLEGLDYQPLPDVVLSSGAAVMTLDYVDATHLLLTFNRRRLLKRIPDDPPTDVDRNIDALLLELPTGKVLARTQWRLHDAGRYLWAMGEGRFALRVRDRLVSLSPMQGLEHGEAFRETPLILSHRPIEMVLLAPTGDLLILETMAHPRSAESAHPQAASTAAATALGVRQATEEPAPVQVDFFRITGGTGNTPVRALPAGTVQSSRAGYLPADTAGWLTAVDQGQAHWAFDFHRHTGKVDELSPYDTTCKPEAMMVSRSEFIAFGCRGGNDRRQIGGFNLRGEEMWEQLFLDSFSAPQIEAAPAGGRFALSRLLVPSELVGTDIVPGAVQGQAVTVFQTESGRQIFNLTPSPTIRTGHNFALSPDGMQLAVVNSGAVEVYPLPAATAKERASMEMASGLVQAADPALPIHLGATGLREIEESYALRNSPGAAGLAAAETGAVVAGADEEYDVGLGTAGVPSAGAVKTAGGPTGASPTPAAAAAKAGEAAASAAEQTAASNRPAPAPAVHEVMMGDPVADPEHPRHAPTLYAPDERHDGGDATGKGNQ